MNTNIIIIANINAVVEKLEGKINIKVINTGSQSSFSDLHKINRFFSGFDKYLGQIQTILRLQKQMAEMKYLQTVFEAIYLHLPQQLLTLIIV
jgi:hypothetical protein